MTMSTTTINKESIWEQLKRAVDSGNLATVQEICESEGLDINATLIEFKSGHCTVLWRAVYENKVDIAKYLLTLQQLEVNVLDTTWRRSPLHCAVLHNSSELAALLLQRGANMYQEDRYGDTPLERAASGGHREVGEVLVSGPVKALLEATEEGATLTATKELLKLYETTAAEHRAVVTTYIAETGRIVQILLDNSRPDTTNIELRDTSLLLLSLITECFSKIADDPKLSFFLFKGELFLQFVELASDDVSSLPGINITTILKTTYVLVQAKIRCDESKSRFLKDLVEVDLFQKFAARIKIYADQENSDVQNRGLQCIAQRIYTEYIAEKSGCIASIIKTLSSAVKTVTKACCQSSNEKERQKVGISHRCKARGYFTLLTCFLGIYFYTNDLVTDFAVGLEDYQIFSTRLGAFELFLVVFTLVHENINSAFMMYETEAELLQIKLGKADLLSQDWLKESQLNYSDNPTTAFVYKIFWPFKVNRNGSCCSRKIKAILFNILSVIMLRPIVDRLVVLLHEPSSLRAYYRQRAEQNSLKQFYLILEQIPELVIQFYTFQIVLNKFSSPVKELQPGCKQDFYLDYSHKFTKNETNFFCGDILSQSASGLDYCGVFFRIYSMLIPFCTIPSGIVGLENGFRILDPTTPKMSSITTYLVHVMYMMIIPSRLFMISAVMHAVPNHFWVIGYIIGRIGLELVVNLTVHKCYVKVIKPSRSWRDLLRWALREDSYARAELLSRLKGMWSLVLFSIRDMFLISLREPYAYTQKPSEVDYVSLRSWKMMVLKSVPFFVEGFAGAILIELYYPCGKQSHIFKYLGWFCMLLLVFSLTLSCLLSGLLHPPPANIVHRGKFMVKSLTVSGCGLAMCFVAALAFLVTKSRTRSEVLAVLCLLGVYLLFFGLVIGITVLFGDAKKKQDDKKKRAGSAPITQEDAITCSVTCSACCTSCLCFLCRSCGRDRPSGTDEDVPLQELPVGTSTSEHVRLDLEASVITGGVEATVKDPLLISA